MVLHSSGTRGVAAGCVLQQLCQQRLRAGSVVHTRAGDSTFMQESQCGTDTKGTAGRWEVCLPFTMHLLRLHFINWLCTLFKLTLGVYGKYCPTSLCLPQRK